MTSGETLTPLAILAPSVHAVVPAAGEGTRMQPLTDDAPKGLVDVAGKPLLAWVFDAIVPLGVEELVVVIGYRGDAIVDRFGEAYRGTPLRYVRQPEPLGLGHAVSVAEPHVDGEFVVVNGDNVIDGDLSTVVDRHRVVRPAVTVPVQSVSREQARETGVVVVEDGRVRSVVEKPDDPPSLTAMTGVQVCSPAVFEALDAVEPSDRGEVELADAIDRLARTGHDVLAVEFPGWRLNVNTPEDVETAARRVG